MPFPESRLHAFVSGVVQGVGFRYFVVDRAAEAEVKGWVRNLRDGRVEIVAEGSRPALEALLVQLRRGPSGGRVDDVAATWEAASGEFRSFALQRTA